jgi:hypothetical protein
LGRLLTSYVVVTILAAIILGLGLWCWIRFIPSNSITRAFLLMQLIMLLLLVPRFWQRAIAVSYWQQSMLVPVVDVPPVEPTAIQVTPMPENDPSGEPATNV